MRQLLVVFLFWSNSYAQHTYPNGVVYPLRVLDIGKTYYATVVFDLEVEVGTFFAIDDLNTLLPSPRFILQTHPSYLNGYNVEYMYMDSPRLTNRLTVQRMPYPNAYARFGFKIGDMDIDANQIWITTVTIKSDNVEVRLDAGKINIATKESEIEFENTPFFFSDHFCPKLSMMPKMNRKKISRLTYDGFDASGQLNYTSVSNFGTYQLVKYDTMHLFTTIELQPRYKIANHLPANQASVILDITYVTDDGVQTKSAFLKNQHEASWNDAGGVIPNDRIFDNPIDTSLVNRSPAYIYLCNVNKIRKTRQCYGFDSHSLTITRMSSKLAHVLGYHAEEGALYGLDSMGRHIRYHVHDDAWKYMSSDIYDKAKQVFERSKTYNWVDSSLALTAGITPMILLEGRKFNVTPIGLYHNDFQRYSIKF